MPRFFIKLQDINNKIITLDENQSKKMRKVLRMKVGDQIRAFDGKGWDYEAQLEKLTNSYSIAKVLNQTLHEKDTNVTLLQALPKNLKIEFVLQKCTELGVDRIVFFESEFSQFDSKKINEEKIKRWRRIAQEASEQCERVFLPEIELWTGNTATLAETVTQSDKVSHNIFYLDIDGKWLNGEGADLRNVSIFVGPEGGFSPKERDIFASRKFTKVKVSNNILRSETAGMTFLSQLALQNKG